MRENFDGEIEKKLCPNCHSLAIYYRKSEKNWRCTSCNCVFDEPFYILLHDPDLEIALHSSFETLNESKIDYIVKIDWLKCVICGKEADHIHHVDLDRENNSIKNFAPLCQSCHSSLHRMLETLIGDIASRREALGALIDRKIPISMIYYAIKRVKEVLDKL